MEKTDLKLNYTIYKVHELSEEDAALWKEAQMIRIRSYSPYSNFTVGAAIRLEDGTIVHGVNQENMAYPAGLCAERVALYAAGAKYPDKAIHTLAVCASPKDGHLVAASPCGGCRQVMVEFEHRQQKPFRFMFQHENENIIIMDSCKDLLPFAFSF